MASSHAAMEEIVRGARRALTRLWTRMMIKRNLSDA